jgi:hypothetical protein
MNPPAELQYRVISIDTNLQSLHQNTCELGNVSKFDSVVYFSNILQPITAEPTQDLLHN